MAFRFIAERSRYQGLSTDDKPYPAAIFPIGASTVPALEAEEAFEIDTGNTWYWDGVGAWILPQSSQDTESLRALIGAHTEHLVAIRRTLALGLDISDPGVLS